MSIKDPETRKQYYREYQEKNKSQLQKNRKRYYQKKKEERDQETKKYRKKHPWVTFHSNGQQRCTNPKHPSYKHYGLKGIKFLLSVEEVKELWFRDKAYLMSRPSLDRDNPNENYEYSNCTFIELNINVGKKVEGH